jgi:hypothetical protein
VSSNSLNLALASWAGQTFIAGILLTGCLTSLMVFGCWRILFHRSIPSARISSGGGAPRFVHQFLGAVEVEVVALGGA